MEEFEKYELWCKWGLGRTEIRVHHHKITMAPTNEPTNIVPTARARRSNPGAETADMAPDELPVEDPPAAPVVKEIPPEEVAVVPVGLGVGVAVMIIEFEMVAPLPMDVSLEHDEDDGIG